MLCCRSDCMKMSLVLLAIEVNLTLVVVLKLYFSIKVTKSPSPINQIETGGR